MKIRDVLLEGEVVPFRQKNPLTPNLIKQLKALSQQALEMAWEGPNMPSAAQGEIAQLSPQEHSRMFKQNEENFRQLGYEYSTTEESDTTLYLHSLAREAWYDAENPPSQYHGLPDLQYDAETNTLSYYDLIGDDGYEYTDTTQFEGVAEGTGDTGAQIRAAYQRIYDQGDDAIEFAYNDSPIFAQYWDEYEGDLDSIIAEVDPEELQVILAELQSAAEDQDISEGSETVCPGCHSADVKTYSDGEKECNHCHKTWDVQGVAAEKTKKEEDQLKRARMNRGYFEEQGVAEGSATMWEVSFDYGPHMTKTVKVNAGSKQEAKAKVEKAAEKSYTRGIMINWVKPVEQGVAEASFDKEAFRRQMADLEAREELRKTDPVSAKALDLRGKLPQQIKKKSPDDSMSINDPRYPGAAYTQGNQLDLKENSQIQRKIARTQALIQDYYNRAKLTTNDIKKNHFLKMADQLQSELDSLINDANEHERDSNMINQHDNEPSDTWNLGGLKMESDKKPEPPEADYGADYQDMVSRVKKLAGLGPLKTVYDPEKRVYRNMPTAEQPKR